MISFILGGFGSGKSYAGMRLARSELTDGSRGIVTNLAIHQPKFGRYFHEEYPKADVRLNQRLRLMQDDDVAQFFLHRISTGGLWYDIPAPDADSEKRGARPDWTKLRDNGILFIIEEAHEFFNSYHWAEIGRAFRAYKNQNRKFSDDIVFITPQIAEIDKQLRTSGQSYTVLTNLGQKKVHGVALPQLFLAREFATIPERTSHPLNTYRYTLDLKLADCYDTAKGVRGVQGGLADKEKKRDGIPFKWVALAAVLLATSVILVLWLFAGRTIKKSLGVSQLADASKQIQRVSSEKNQKPTEAAAQVAVERQANVLTNSDADLPVEMTGYCKLGDKWLVVLSDGTTYETGDVELRTLAKKFCIICTNQVMMHHFDPRKPEMSEIPPAVSQIQAPAPLLQERSQYSAPALVYVIPNRSPLDMAGRGHVSQSSISSRMQATSQTQPVNY